jgi:hypothetical protein
MVYILSHKTQLTKRFKLAIFSSPGYNLGGNNRGEMQVLRPHVLIRAALMLLGPVLACALVRQTPQPAPALDQLVFEIQTSTPTLTPVFLLADVPTNTPDPNAATPTPIITPTLNITPTLAAEPEATSTPAAAVAAEAPAAPAPPPPTPTVLLSEPLRGGAWDFEDGFAGWVNPYGDLCPGSGLAVGWAAFTSRDQFGSSCMNQTVWRDNVYSGESAQEITFAYVGNQAGLYKAAPTIPGHRYTIEAFARREFSPARLELALGVDLTGGGDWQANTIQWFPWADDAEDAWARTEATVTATGDVMTVFIKGSHPYPEPGGALRIDAISVVDIGPE